MINLEKAIDYIGEHCDKDSRVEKIFIDFYGTPTESHKTQRILEYFTPQMLDDPDDEPPRKKLKGISLDDIGITMLYIGWAIGFLQGKSEN